MAVEPKVSAYVRLDGSLDDNETHRRQAIYQTTSGKQVERFYAGERSYIYKPISDAARCCREWWAVAHVVPRLQQIKVPAITAASVWRDEAAASHWLIYEDLGELQHARKPAHIIEAAGWIPEWQQLPPGIVPDTYDGHTPRYERILDMVLATGSDLLHHLESVSADAVQAWLRQIEELPARLPSLAVVSHGDYHPLNVAFNRGERIVLDWEYVHRNHPYWDLYSLMDITSFRYEKVQLTNSDREQALSRFYQQLRQSRSSHLELLWQDMSEVEFIRGYYWYASLYSAWIAGLIAKDLAEGIYPAEALRKQREETSNVFADCLLALGR